MSSNPHAASCKTFQNKACWQTFDTSQSSWWRSWRRRSCFTLQKTSFEIQICLDSCSCTGIKPFSISHRTAPTDLQFFILQRWRDPSWRDAGGLATASDSDARGNTSLSSCIRLHCNRIVIISCYGYLRWILSVNFLRSSDLRDLIPEQRQRCEVADVTYIETTTRISMTTEETQSTSNLLGDIEIGVCTLRAPRVSWILFSL